MPMWEDYWSFASCNGTRLEQLSVQQSAINVKGQEREENEETVWNKQKCYLHEVSRIAGGDFKNGVGAPKNECREACSWERPKTIVWFKTLWNPCERFKRFSLSYYFSKRLIHVQNRVHHYQYTSRCLQTSSGMPLLHSLFNAKFILHCIRGTCTALYASTITTQNSIYHGYQRPARCSGRCHLRQGQQFWVVDWIIESSYIRVKIESVFR